MMDITYLNPVDPKKNPFDEDEYNMGVKIGKNCFVMYSNPPSETCNYVIIVNRTTGERMRIALTEEGLAMTLSETLMGKYRKVK